MSAVTVSFQNTAVGWQLPSRGKVAMASLIFAESAIFTIFVVAYLFYIGKSLTGPTPREVLEVPIFFTVCLLSSSLTIHLASTYYSLVGLHAFHVTVGLVMLLMVAIFGIAGRVGVSQSARIEVLSMYWHFVDAVWVVVFTVVYVLGR